MVLANIMRGTFFRYYNKRGIRLQAQCPLCPEICTSEHLCSHLQAALRQLDQPELPVEYLAMLTGLVAPKFGALPNPIQIDQAPAIRTNEEKSY